MAKQPLDTSGLTLTRLAALGTLSGTAGEGGPSLQSWVGDGCIFD